MVEKGWALGMPEAGKVASGGGKEVEMEGARMESEPVLLWLISGGRK